MNLAASNKQVSSLALHWPKWVIQWSTMANMAAMHFKPNSENPIKSKATQLHKFNSHQNKQSNKDNLGKMDFLLHQNLTSMLYLHSYFLEGSKMLQS